MASQPDDLLQTLANHDAAINTLGGRMSGVETSVHKLQGEVHSGFAALGSKLDKMDAQQDAQPKYEFHKVIQSVRDLAILFSMVVGGIIWITTGQFSGIIAKQDSLNGVVVERLKMNQSDIDKLAERTQWLPTAPKRN